MNAITFESILRSLVALTAALALVWLACWVTGVAWRRWSTGDSPDCATSAAGRRIAKLTEMAARFTNASALIVASLIMLYGLGLRELPRVSWGQIGEWITGSGLPILFILGSALVLIRAVSLLARSAPRFLVPESLPLAERLDRRRRVATRGRFARWLASAVVLTIAAIMVMRKIEFDMTPVLAGGAIISVALGFGAQNLVRDVIGGLFLILEDQVRVGDVTSINGKSGLVESIHFRTVVLRGLDGTVHIIPNGSITELSNLTKNFSYYVIDLGVAYKENVDAVMELLRKIGEELRGDPKYLFKILEPLEILGVDDFAASAVMIKLRIKTVPLEQWAVGRELRRRIKNRFDEAGIEIPVPQLSISNRDQRQQYPAADQSIAKTNVPHEPAR